MAIEKKKKLRKHFNLLIIAKKHKKKTKRIQKKKYCGSFGEECSLDGRGLCRRSEAGRNERKKKQTIF